MTQGTRDRARETVEVLDAARHLVTVWDRGHSIYISENGRRGGSPWAELFDAVELANGK